MPGIDDLLDPLLRSNSDGPPVVLVCDDDPNARSIAEGALTAHGYTVLQAEDGEQAIQVCKDRTPDIIVIDLMMPKLTGTAFVAWLRSNIKSPYIPVLLVTARAEIEQKVRGLEVGADDYLTKPYHYRELQARVDALLRIKNALQELYARTEELGRTQNELSELKTRLEQKAGAQDEKALRDAVSGALSDLRSLRKMLTTEAAGEEPGLLLARMEGRLEQAAAELGIVSAKKKS